MFKQLSEEALSLIEKFDNEKMDLASNYVTNHVRCHFDYFMYSFKKGYPTIYHSLAVHSAREKLITMSIQGLPESEMVVQWNMLMATIIDQVIQQDNAVTKNNQ
jgi:hypothetical protein